MGTYLTTNRNSSLVIKKAEVLKAAYGDEFDQKGLEQMLLRETDEEITLCILRRINPNFCLGSVVKYAASKNSVLVVAGTAFNRIKLCKDIELKKRSYDIVAKNTPHSLVKRAAEKYAAELGKVHVLVQPKLRLAKMNTAENAEIVVFPTKKQ